MQTALAGWLFPDFSVVHRDWFTSWFPSKLFDSQLFDGYLTGNPERGPLTRQLDAYVRRFCGTPVFPAGEIATALCACSEQRRLMIGKQLALFAIAPVVRGLIAGDKVTRLQQAFGEHEYLKLLHGRVTTILHAKQLAELERELIHACDQQKLLPWISALSIHLLATLIGRDEQFARRRVALSVSPQVAQHCENFRCIDSDSLAALYQELQNPDELIEGGDLNETISN